MNYNLPTRSKAKKQKPYLTLKDSKQSLNYNNNFNTTTLKLLSVQHVLFLTLTKFSIVSKTHLLDLLNFLLAVRFLYRLKASSSPKISSTVSNHKLHLIKRLNRKVTSNLNRLNLNLVLRKRLNSPRKVQRNLLTHVSYKTNPLVLANTAIKLVGFTKTKYKFDHKSDKTLYYRCNSTGFDLKRLFRRFKKFNNQKRFFPNSLKPVRNITRKILNRTGSELVTRLIKISSNRLHNKTKTRKVRYKSLPKRQFLRRRLFFIRSRLKLNTLITNSYAYMYKLLNMNAVYKKKIVIKRNKRSNNRFLISGTQLVLSSLVNSSQTQLVDVLSRLIKKRRKVRATKKSHRTILKQVVHLPHTPYILSNQGKPSRKTKKSSHTRIFKRRLHFKTKLYNKRNRLATPLNTNLSKITRLVSSLYLSQAFKLNTNLTLLNLTSFRAYTNYVKSSYKLHVNNLVTNQHFLRASVENNTLKLNQLARPFLTPLNFVRFSFGLGSAFLNYNQPNMVNLIKVNRFQDKRNLFSFVVSNEFEKFLYKRRRSFMLVRVVRNLGNNLRHINDKNIYGRLLSSINQSKVIMNYIQSNRSFIGSTVLNSKNELRYSNTTNMFDYNQNEPKSYRSVYDVAIPRLRFRRGYQTLWRRYRLDLKEYLGLHFVFQKRLTKYVSRLAASQTKWATVKTLISLKDVLIASHLAPDYNTTKVLTSRHLVTLNSKTAYNLNAILLIGDVVAVTISNWYYIFYKWVRSWTLIRNKRLKRLVYYKSRAHSYKLSKQKKTKSYYIPKWIRSLMYDGIDIKPYLEVDFFTLSSVVTFDPYTSLDHRILSTVHAKGNIYRLYNWKYIT